MPATTTKSEEAGTSNVMSTSYLHSLQVLWWSGKVGRKTTTMMWGKDTSIATDSSLPSLSYSDDPVQLRDHTPPTRHHRIPYGRGSESSGSSSSAIGELGVGCV
jgi:hypothetical protein